LPLLMELAGRDAGVQAGPVLGRMLAVNTVGSILGPLLAGFVMNRLIGLWWSLALIGMLMFILGALSLHLHALRSVPASRRFLLYAVLTACFWLLNPAGLPRVRFDADKGERVAFLKEGSYGTVAVLQDEDHRWMLINNHYVLGGTVSASEERQQGHIPLFLHPSPRDVAFLGMGTGITAGAALLHPVRSVVVLELVPEVIDAAKAHFADVNFNLASDARVEIRAEDARNFLKGSSRRFDVIVGDLVVPWRPGESSLFSLQHFRATREALLPGGIFCQWLPLFQLSEGGFRIIAATFLEVYPRAMLWRGDFLAGQPAVALIGARDPAPLDPSSIDGRLRELAPRLKDLNPYLADPAGFWLFLIGPLDSSDPHYSGARRNEDGRPWLELLAPGGSGGSSGSDALRHARFEAELFEEVKARTLGGSPLERLDDLHLAWRGAGAGLWQASMLAAAGNDQAAQSQAMSILSTLPAPLQSSLLKR
jgi:spermidine synthase